MDREVSKFETNKSIWELVKKMEEDKKEEEQSQGRGSAGTEQQQASSSVSWSIHALPVPCLGLSSLSLSPFSSPSLSKPYIYIYYSHSRKSQKLGIPLTIGIWWEHRHQYHTLAICNAIRVRWVKQSTTKYCYYRFFASSSPLHHVLHIHNTHPLCTTN